MKELQLYDLETIDNIAYPENYKNITIDSPASMIFTDFKHVYPLVIEADTLAIDALKLMAKAHVQMKIVVSGCNNLRGIVSSKELSEQNILIQVGKGNSREDLLVRDMMLPKDCIQAFDHESIKKSTVKEVVNVLKNYGLSHCLVLDRQRHKIRGVISSSDIARKLHLPIEINTKTSFSKLFKIIND